jgi:putative lipoic acid-binding regulatory protein
MSPDETLQTFPCDYTFKIFGRLSDTFVERVRDILAQTFGALPDEAVIVRSSSGGRYLSVTVSQWVDSRDQLEIVYTALKAEPEVLLYI